MTGYGWGDDENCFPPGADRFKIIVGSMRYSPVVGAYNQTNVSVAGAGTIDGQGAHVWGPAHARGRLQCSPSSALWPGSSGDGRHACPWACSDDRRAQRALGPHVAGEVWWQNCTACHYPPHNDSAHCEVARSTHARERVVSSLQFKVGGDNQRRP